MSTHETTSPGEVDAPADETPPARRREVLAILAAAGTAVTALALASYDARAGVNLIGPVGRGLAVFLCTAFGFAAWLLPVELTLVSVRLFRGKRDQLGLASLAATIVVMIVGCVLLHLSLAQQTVFGGHSFGGVVGEVLGEVARALLGTTGALLTVVSLLLMTLVLRTSVSVIGVATWLGRQARDALARASTGVYALGAAWKEAREIERAAREAERLAQQPKVIPSPAGTVGAVVGDADDGAQVHDLDDAIDVPSEELAAENEGEAAELSAPRDAPTEPPARAPSGSRRRVPKIIMRAEPPKKNGAAAAAKPAKSDGPFRLPSTSLLVRAPTTNVQADEAHLLQTAGLLVEKLKSFGVLGRVDEIHPGPVVTMYEFEPQSGTKLSKIAGLADDLAMALAAQKVRIVAPIPGKARVGFELPNPQRQTVYLREILEDDRWRSLNVSLPVALGKDIFGDPVYCDLSKMPHLLVAGSTGSGKSVGINVMLASLLFKMTPREVRLIMIDPKKVELGVFDGIPHMLLPVVVDTKLAARALRWAADEMERRYQLFADTGVRSILTYNERVARIDSGELAREKFYTRRVAQPVANDENGTAEAIEKLPHVVLVVDEVLDLMMTVAKEVEGTITRLAGKARAAGIHVILATQRPSVDVITGIIKANLPCRIAYQVRQREDSKTILGCTGAEHLLGQGDMLMIPPGTSDLLRVQNAYIGEAEVEALCDFLRKQGKPVYDDNIIKPRDDEDDDDGGGLPSTDDPLYDRAVRVVADAGYCSISHIQRQLSVGYNKAANLVEQMEKQGIVGPASGKAGGRREVLVQPQ